MEQRELISIIIPVYNTELYLQRCIDSILNQTYANLEVLLIDDGSTDLSLVICKKYEKKDSRVRVFHQSNAGASAARNVGLENAKGEYIMFVDSDDFIGCEMVECHYKAVKQFNSIFVQSLIPNDKIVYRDSAVISNVEALKNILSGTWWGPCGKLYQKEAIGNLRFPLETISEDYAFNVELCMNNGSICFLNQAFYFREIRRQGLSRLPLCERKFDEYYNVKHVSDLIYSKYPEMANLADNHLAGSILKLLFAIFESHADAQYAIQKEMLLRAVRQNYWRFLLNKTMLRKQKFLLALSFSGLTSKWGYKLYRFISQ